MFTLHPLTLLRRIQFALSQHDLHHSPTRYVQCQPSKGITSQLHQQLHLVAMHRLITLQCLLTFSSRPVSPPRRRRRHNSVQGPRWSFLRTTLYPATKQLLIQICQLR